jgi:hypothetical protein
VPINFGKGHQCPVGGTRVATRGQTRRSWWTLFPSFLCDRSKTLTAHDRLTVSEREEGVGVLGVRSASQTVQISATSVSQWILHCTYVLYRWHVWPQPEADGSLFSAISAQQVFSLYLPAYKPLKPNGHYTYHQFNINKFYVLPTPCIYVFCVDLRTNSNYFTVQHWLVCFYNRDGVCLLRSTFYILRSAHILYLCVLCGSENKQRLFHCTALTGWFL